MKCTDCKFYYSGYMYNECSYTESECFKPLENCNLVNDDGTISEEGLKLFGEVKE